MRPFTVGLDASNLRAGGGLAYLVNLLKTDSVSELADSRVIVWAGERTLSRIEPRPWIIKESHPLLETSAIAHARWQRRDLDLLATKCDVLFVPGGTYLGSFRPFVTMSHNLLPFDSAERRRYGLSRTRVRLELLRSLQSRTFKRADGVIFLTEAAKSCIETTTGPLLAPHATIPHGIDSAFLKPPRLQEEIGRYATTKPFKWLYVSIVNLYKHQWNVVAAAARLRAAGLPITLDLVGPAYPPALRRLRESLARYDPESEYIRYHGPLSGNELLRMYHDANALVFASTCENMPIILLEGMAAGLPIVCGDRPVMREVLRDGGEYSNPERVDDLAGAMTAITLRPEKRSALAQRAFELAGHYQWSTTVQSTFAFLRQVGRGADRWR